MKHGRKNKEKAVSTEVIQGQIMTEQVDQMKEEAGSTITVQRDRVTE